MQGVSVKSAKTLERGFEHDRRYMLIDKEGTFLSQRTHPQLVFFYPQIIEDELIINHKDDSISIPLSASLHNTVKATLFGKAVRATEVSHEANLWLSSNLSQDVRLVKMNPEDIRHKELIKGPPQVEVSFADGYPYLIVGTDSLDLLNSKVDSSLSSNRFRANIIVETSEPHIEDSWEEIKIGDIGFLIIKSCARCPVVTVDQSTGTKSKEPLKSLATYRKKENKIYFGANAISREEGYVHIGDEVVVL